MVAALAPPAGGLSLQELGALASWSIARRSEAIEADIMLLQELLSCRGAPSPLGRHSWGGPALGRIGSSHYPICQKSSPCGAPLSFFLPFLSLLLLCLFALHYSVLFGGYHK